jgi:hypothetical protein
MRGNNELVKVFLKLNHSVAFHNYCGIKDEELAPPFSKGGQGGL